MVHHRLNEREAHPNKHINFITALPAPEVLSPFSEEDARQLLRALAAQVRPVMKSHGFEVNSFEEYEFNRVFAGRNWNNGETVELVLRRADSTFVPVPWLLSTLCHELAHIKHMNHGRDFQRLWAQLRAEVMALQQRGYYGDGYWSSGTRLTDSARVGGRGIEDFELPEYVCGGAQTRSRPKRRRTQQRHAGPSKRRKAGSRVTAKGKFRGDGRALNADISDEEERAKGTGFRKQAGSKRAREERALAAEKRFKALQGNATPVKTEKDGDSVTDESDYESSSKFVETDEQRKRSMRETMKDGELEDMKQFMRDFLREPSPGKGADKGEFAGLFDAIEISDDEDDIACDLPSASNPVAPQGAGKLKQNDSSGSLGISSTSPLRSSPQTSKSIGIGRLAQEEISLRRRESLGLVGERKLGSGSTSSLSGLQKNEQCRGNGGSAPRSPQAKTRGDEKWNCLVCTLDNLPSHLACSACATPRGESAWAGQAA